MLVYLLFEYYKINYLINVASGILLYPSKYSTIMGLLYIVIYNNSGDGNGGGGNINNIASTNL